MTEKKDFGGFSWKILDPHVIGSIAARSTRLLGKRIWFGTIVKAYAWPAVEHGGNSWFMYLSFWLSADFKYLEVYFCFSNFDGEGSSLNFMRRFAH